MAAAPALPLAFLTSLDRYELSAETAPKSWIQVAKTGSFVNAKYGELNITRDDLVRMLSNFKSEYPQQPYQLPVDYEHFSTSANRKPGDGIAAGWFLDLELRNNGDELWGLIEWTQPAAEKIRNKEYRFVSPTFMRTWTTNKGREIGTTLIAAALTNIPFLNMQAITLSNDDTLAVAKPRGTNMKTIKLKDASGNEVEIPASAISLDALSGVPEIDALKSKVPGDGARVVSSDEFDKITQKVTELSNITTDLKARAESAETRAREAEKKLREETLSSLKRTGRIDGADETFGKGLLEMSNGGELFDKWADAMKTRAPKVELGAVHGSGGEGDNVTPDAQKFVALVEEYEKTNKVGRREALAAIQLSHPLLAKAYREDVPDYQTARPIKNVVQLTR